MAWYNAITTEGATARKRSGKWTVFTVCLWRAMMAFVT